MKHTQIILLGISLFVISLAQGQKKFAQIEELIPTPNEYRNAAGAPGYNYYQQQADYKMDIEIDDVNAKLYGNETRSSGRCWYLDCEEKIHSECS